MSQHSKWVCPKCRETSFESGEFHAAGGNLSKFFDIQNTKFSTVTCTRCSFTEIYRCSKDELSNVIDFFVGG